MSNFFLEFITKLNLNVMRKKIISAANLIPIPLMWSFSSPPAVSSNTVLHVPSNMFMCYSLSFHEGTIHDFLIWKMAFINLLCPPNTHIYSQSPSQLYHNLKIPKLTVIMYAYINLLFRWVMVIFSFFSIFSLIFFIFKLWSWMWLLVM